MTSRNYKRARVAAFAAAVALPLTSISPALAQSSDDPTLTLSPSSGSTTFGLFSGLDDSINVAFFGEANDLSSALSTQDLSDGSIRLIESLRLDDRAGVADLASEIADTRDVVDAIDTFSSELSSARDANSVIDSRSADKLVAGLESLSDSTLVQDKAANGDSAILDAIDRLLEQLKQLPVIGDAIAAFQQALSDIRADFASRLDNVPDQPAGNGEVTLGSSDSALSRLLDRLRDEGEGENVEPNPDRGSFTPDELPDFINDNGDGTLSADTRGAQPGTYPVTGTITRADGSVDQVSLNVVIPSADSGQQQPGTSNQNGGSQTGNQSNTDGSTGSQTGGSDAVNTGEVRYDSITVAPGESATVKPAGDIENKMFVLSKNAPTWSKVNAMTGEVTVSPAETVKDGRYTVDVISAPKSVIDALSQNKADAENAVDQFKDKIKTSQVVVNVQSGADTKVTEDQLQSSAGASGSSDSGSSSSSDSAVASSSDSGATNASANEPSGDNMSNTGASGSNGATEQLNDQGINTADEDPAVTGNTADSEVAADDAPVDNGSAAPAAEPVAYNATASESEPLPVTGVNAQKALALTLALLASAAVFGVIGIRRVKA